MKRIQLVAIPVVLLGAAGVATHFSSTASEGQYRHALKSFESDPAFSKVESSYQRGWLQSSAESVFVVPDAEGDEVTVSLRTEFQHWPHQTQLRSTLAFVDNENADTMLTQIFGTTTPLSWEATVTAWSTLESRAVLLAGNYSADGVNWTSDPMNITADGDLQGMLDIHLNWPGMRGKGADWSMAMGAMNSASSMPASWDRLSAGTGVLTVDSLSMQSAQGPLQQLVLNDFRLDTEAALDKAADRYDMTLDLRLAALSSTAQNVESALSDSRLKLSMTKLKASAFEAMQQLSQQDIEAGGMLQVMQSMIANGPRLSIDELSLGDASGRVLGHANVELPPGLTMAQLEQAREQVIAKADLNVDEALLQHPLLSGGLSMLMLMQVLVAEEGSEKLAMNAEMAQGQLVLNGKPVPLN